MDSTFKSEAMLLNWKRVGCPLQVGGDVLCLWVLFTGEGKMERETDRQIGAASAVMWPVMRSMYWKLIEGTWLDLLMGEKGRKWTMGVQRG